MTVRKLIASVPVITLLLINCFGPLDPNDPYTDPGTIVTPENVPAVQKGMVAYWKFNEGKESSSLDVTINKNTLIVNNCIWDSGVDSSALKFDGSSSYAYAYDDSSLNFGTGDFTISLWIKPQKITSESGRYDIISKGEVGQGFTVSLFRNRVSAFVGSIVTVGDADTNLTIYDTTWHNIVVLRKSSKVSTYLDSKFVHSYEFTGNISNNSTLLIGKNSSGDSFYAGMLDEVKLQNVAWTAQQIAAEKSRFTK